MKFKILRHKKYPDQFGIFQRKGYSDYEICLTKIPELISESSSIENLKEKHKNSVCFFQLNNYDLIEVELFIQNELPSAELEQQVLSDFFDYCQNEPNVSFESAKELMHKFLNNKI